METIGRVAAAPPSSSSSEGVAAMGTATVAVEMWPHLEEEISDVGAGNGDWGG